MAVPISFAGGTVRPGVPVELFRNDAFGSPVRLWDVHPDGKRFLIAEPDESGQTSASIHLVQNWTALLREKSSR